MFNIISTTLWILVANFIEYFVSYYSFIENYIFYQVDFEGEVSPVAHFSFTHRYTAPDNDRINHRNMS
jgi:hypothetical protein